MVRRIILYQLQDLCSYNRKQCRKAQGGKRVLYTTHNPTYDGGKEFDLPEELEA